MINYMKWGFLHPNPSAGISVASCLNKATTKPQDLGEHHWIIEISQLEKHHEPMFVLDGLMDHSARPPA